MPETVVLSQVEAAIIQRVRELRPFMSIEIRMVEDRVTVVCTSKLKEDYPL